MNYYNTFNLCFLALLTFSTGCKLTEKSVVGKWTSGSDTLFVNHDHSFRLSDNRNYNTTKDYLTSLDRTFVYVSGNWTLTRRTLFLRFNQDKKDVFGNCDQLWNWTRFLSKYKLVRPSLCYEASNRFVTFKKIRT